MESMHEKNACISKPKYSHFEWQSKIAEGLVLEGQSNYIPPGYQQSYQTGSQVPGPGKKKFKRVNWNNKVDYEENETNLPKDRLEGVHPKGHSKRNLLCGGGFFTIIIANIDVF